MTAGIAFVLLLILFLISHMQSRLLSSVFLRAVHNHELVIKAIALIFFPGVLIHELAHFFMASLLFVPTGEMEFVPVVHGNTVKLGSVAIAKTDIFRRFLIGVAPLLFGLAVMMSLYWFLSPVTISLNWKMGLLLFVLFEIGNTMFSSKKDLEGAIGIVIISLFALVAAVLFHLPLDVWGTMFFASPLVATMCWNIGILVGIVVGMDGFFVSILLLLKYALRRK